MNDTLNAQTDPLQSIILSNNGSTDPDEPCCTLPPQDDPPKGIQAPGDDESL